MADERQATAPVSSNSAEPSASSFDATLDHRAESTIFGDYELVDEIARGGMGIVYKARQRSLDRIIALKLVLSGTEANQDELSRFRVEAQAAARLDHPFIVPVYGFGQLEGRPFLSMGFVNGPSLAARLARSGPLPPREAAELLGKVAEAIHYAHSQGVIHRDLKPGNVLIDEHGEPRVTDFGLAKRQDTEQSLTDTGQVLGTPAYMSPEQAAGDTVGPAGDIYSLGATLYAALSGQPPFEATSLPELLMKVADEPPRPLHERDPRIPATLSAICQRCLAKAPDERYRTAEELADDLRRYLSGSAVRGARPSRASRLPLVAGVVAVGLALASVLGYSWFTGGRPVEEARVAPPEASPPPVAPVNPNALTEAERTLLAELAAAVETLSPAEGTDPWSFRFAESAAAFRAAFVQFGLDPASTSADDWSARLAQRPAELRESVVDALERWEYVAAAAKHADGPALRALQASLDEVDWRRKGRFLRDDNNAAALLAYWHDLDLATLSEAQVETLGLASWSFPPETADATNKLLERLRASQPKCYWPHVAVAAGFVARAKAQPAEQARLAAEAVPLLRAAQGARPKSSVPVRQLADVFERVGNAVAATAERERAAALEYPIAWEQVERARRARAEGRFAEAIAAADSACAAAPRLLAAAVEAVQARLAQTPPQEDETALRRLANLPATDDEAMKAFLAIYEALAPSKGSPSAQKLIDLEDRSRRREAWSRVVALRDNPGDLAYLELAKALDSCGRDGLPAFREAVRRNPQRADTLRACAIYMFQHHRDHAETIEMAERAIAVDPQTRRHDMDLIIALTKARAGDIQAARAMFRDEIAERTKSPNDLFSLPWQQHFGQASGLVADVAQDLAADGPRRFSNPWLHDLCRLQLMAPSLSESEVTAELARLSSLVLARNFGDYWLGTFIQAAVRCGRMNLQSSFLSSHLIEKNDAPLLWMAMASISLQRGDVDFAVQAAEHAERLLLNQSPQVRDRINEVVSVLGLSYLSSGKLREAHECLRPLCQAYPTENCLVQPAWSWHGGFQGDFARTLIALGEIDDAERRCAAQRQMRPEDGNIEWASGLVEIARARSTESLSHFAKAALLDPLNAAIYLDWAQALVASGDAQAALLHLQTAVQRAERGQLRGFRLVAAEAAEVALRIADDKTLDDATRSEAQGAAFKWFRDDLTRWSAQARGDDEEDMAAAAQQLPKLLKCPAAVRLRGEVFLDTLAAADRTAWDELWHAVEVSAGEATARYAALPQDRLQHFLARSKLNESEVAKKVLAEGGSLTIVTPDKIWLEQLVTSAEALPQGAYKVTAVSYRDCAIDDGDLAPLEKLPYLQHLFLDRTKVTDDGVRRLVKRRVSLRTLNLNGTQVTKSLLPSLGSMGTISLRGAEIDAAALAAFAKQHPQVELLPRSTTEKPIRRMSAENSPKSFALKLDGASRVNLPLKCIANEPITMEVWVQVPAEIFTSHSHPLVGFGRNSAGQHRLLGLNLNDRNRLSGEARDATGGLLFVRTDKRLATDQWSHLAVSFDGAEIRVHLDGKRCASTPLVLPADNTAMAMAIGAWHRGDWPFVGLMDEVRISSTARYAGDFVPLRRFEPDEQTLALYHFDEGEGEVVRDSSGHSHDGKVIGSPKWVPEVETEE